MMKIAIKQDFKKYGFWDEELNFKLFNSLKALLNYCRRKYINFEIVNKDDLKKEKRRKKLREEK